MRKEVQKEHFPEPVTFLPTLEQWRDLPRLEDGDDIRMIIHFFQI